MKTIVIGDIHGRTIWKDIVRQDFDRVIFLGDYCTSHDDISPIAQINNLEDILLFKSNDPNRVVLLRGNHDCQLLGYPWAECYPTEPEVQKYMSKPEFKEYFLNNTQWIYIDDKVIFSHAGVSEVWLKYVAFLNSVEKINNLLPSGIFGFTPDNPYDNYGTSKSQPPTWIRPSSLCTCNVEGYDQVIGHTTVNDIVNIYKTTKKHQNIWLCDALEVKEYLLIENKNFIVKTYEN